MNWQRSMAATVLLILLIVAASFLATSRINQMEENRSFTRLYEETNNLVWDIEDAVESDQKQMKALADVVAGYEDLDSPELWRVLDSYSGIDMMARLELLLPDNTVLTTGGKRIDAEGKLSFETESAKGVHLSDRETDLENDGKYIVRSYVPVIKEGETLAMLYSVIDLARLPEEMAAEPYGGEAAVYLIDGATGDFLMDTWHNEPGGNIWALGERQMAPGYNHEQLKQGLIDGKTGYVVFVSETIGENLYFYYEPVSVNQWRVALSVPRDTVFAGADGIRNVLNMFLLFEAVCFILYFLWMIFYVRSVTNEKQRQLDTIQYIYDVEKLLFNAHENRGNMEKALEKIAHMTSAGKAGFWIVEDSRPVHFFSWAAQSEKKSHEAAEGPKTAAWLLEYFKEGNRLFTAHGEQEIQEKIPDEARDTVRSLVAVPVEAVDGTICGILEIYNSAERKWSPTMLKSVEFSFGMFCNNLHSYNMIKAKGERDALTGLYNRNRYEMDLLTYPDRYEYSLACVYIDVNGLHELNNSSGHESGDNMLKTVAAQIRKMFGEQYTYRIGGDEFLAFASDMEKETAERLGKELTEVLEQQNIYVSVGVQWQEHVPSINTLIKAAEKNMYAKKTAFYEQQNPDRKIRN